jgi:hypothetical protein
MGLRASFGLDSLASRFCASVALFGFNRGFLMRQYRLSGHPEQLNGSRSPLFSRESFKPRGEFGDDVCRDSARQIARVVFAGPASAMAGDGASSDGCGARPSRLLACRFVHVANRTREFLYKCEATV